MGETRILILISCRALCLGCPVCPERRCRTAGALRCGPCGDVGQAPAQSKQPQYTLSLYCTPALTWPGLCALVRGQCMHTVGRPVLPMASYNVTTLSPREPQLHERTCTCKDSQAASVPGLQHMGITMRAASACITRSVAADLSCFQRRHTRLGLYRTAMCVMIPQLSARGAHALYSTGLADSPAARHRIRTGHACHAAQPQYGSVIANAVRCSACRGLPPSLARCCN